MGHEPLTDDDAKVMTLVHLSFLMSENDGPRVVDLAH